MRHLTSVHFALALTVSAPAATAGTAPLGLPPTKWFADSSGSRTRFALFQAKPSGAHPSAASSLGTPNVTFLYQIQRRSEVELRS
jgi:hypothetical protein